jgi:hypothetical protein
LINWVLPGVADVLARFFVPVIMLINDDLPTLLLPIKAYSGLSGLGQEAVSGLLMIYVALWMIIGSDLQFL